MIETIRPGAGEQTALSEAEHRSFADIVERFDVVLDPELIEDADACLYLNETLNYVDLQADKVAELRQTRDELLREFLEHPRDAYIAEVLNYARLCEGRSTTATDTMGTTTTEFVTSDHEHDKADLHFRISQFPSGKVSITTEVPLKGEMFEHPEPFYITATSDGEFSVKQKVWRRGQYQYIPMPLGEDGRGEDRLTRFFLFSTEAVHLAYTRQPEERLAADAKAKHYLRVKNYGLDRN